MATLEPKYDAPGRADRTPRPWRASSVPGRTKAEKLRRATTPLAAVMGSNPSE
jgi:hypothetical protein